MAVRQRLREKLKGLKKLLIGPPPEPEKRMGVFALTDVYLAVYFLAFEDQKKEFEQALMDYRLERDCCGWFIDSGTEETCPMDGKLPKTKLEKSDWEYVLSTGVDDFQKYMSSKSFRAVDETWLEKGIPVDINSISDYSVTLVDDPCEEFKSNGFWAEGREAE